MRCKVRLPRHLFHEALGMFADLGLVPRGSEEREEIILRFTERNDAYLIVLPRLLGPAGFSFVRIEEEPARQEKSPPKRRARKR